MKTQTTETDKSIISKLERLIKGIESSIVQAEAKVTRVEQKLEILREEKKEADRWLKAKIREQDHYRTFLSEVKALAAANIEEFSK